MPKYILKACLGEYLGNNMNSSSNKVSHKPTSIWYNIITRKEKDFASERWNVAKFNKVVISEFLASYILVDSHIQVLIKPLTLFSSSWRNFMSHKNYFIKSPFFYNKLLITPHK